MATTAQCRAALTDLASRLQDMNPEHRTAFDRSLSCTVPDLDVVFSGALTEGTIQNITTDPAPKAQIRLTASSDDLVALTRGELNFAQAWLGGRLKVEAGVRDLLRLRSML